MSRKIMSRKILQIDTKEVYNTFNLDVFTDLFPLVDGENFEIAGHVGPAIVTIFDFDLSSTFNKCIDMIKAFKEDYPPMTKEEFQEKVAKHFCNLIIDFWIDQPPTSMMILTDSCIKTIVIDLWTDLIRDSGGNNFG